jgi:uncharacterized protein (TIGR02145 family)
MMVDGKYADESKTSSAWDESWASPYYFNTGTPNSNPNADRNNARGTISAKGGGRGICPRGWHVPTILEWAQMLDAISGTSIFTSNSDYNDSWLGGDTGKKLKSAETYTGEDPGNGAWYNSINNGTDIYGFAIVPSGNCYATYGIIRERGLRAYLWSATRVADGSSTAIDMSSGQARVNPKNHLSAHGFSVRCIQD